MGKKNKQNHHEYKQQIKEVDAREILNSMHSAPAPTAPAAPSGPAPAPVNTQQANVSAQNFKKHKKPQLKRGDTESDEVSERPFSDDPASNQFNRNSPTKKTAPATPFYAQIKLGNFKYAIAGIVFLVGLLYLKAQEESFNVGSGINRNEGQDYYDVLGVARGSDISEIRRAYKKLAVQLHPDKNTECKECAEKFGQISIAYDTLSNPEKRRVYDKVKGGFDLIPSDFSLSLTSSNFQVTNSDDIWIIQTYSDTDSSCRHFAPFWESVAGELGSSLKFARINANTDRDTISRLPVKVRAHPTVLMLTRDNYPAIFPLTDLSKDAFRKWIESEIPDNFGISTGKPLVTVETFSGKANFEQKMAAFNWRNVFDFGIKKGAAKKTRFLLPDGSEALENSADASLSVLSRNFQVDLNPDLLERLCHGGYCFGFSEKFSAKPGNTKFQPLFAPCMQKELGAAWVYDFDGELVAKNLKVENARAILEGDDPEAVEDLFFKPFSKSEFRSCGKTQGYRIGQVVYYAATAAAAVALWLVWRRK